MYNFGTTPGILFVDELMDSQAAGIKPGTIRAAVGIENADDLIADFQQALSSIVKPEVSNLLAALTRPCW